MSFSSPGVNSDFSLVLLPDGIGQGWVSRGRGGSPAAPFLLPRGSSVDAVWDCVDGLSALEVGEASLLLFACRDPPGLSQRSGRVGLLRRCGEEGLGLDPGNPGNQTAAAQLPLHFPSAWGPTSQSLEKWAWVLGSAVSKVFPTDR